MKISFNRPHFTGTRTYAKGETADIGDDIATALVKAGVASPAKDKPTVETATQPAAKTETATA